MSELRRLSAGHPGALPVTTAKDAVKLPAGEPPGLTVLGRRVVFAGGDGERLIESVAAVLGGFRRG
jgi:hypothetical protein